MVRLELQRDRHRPSEGVEEVAALQVVPPRLDGAAHGARRAPALRAQLLEQKETIEAQAAEIAALRAQITQEQQAEPVAVATIAERKEIEVQASRVAAIDARLATRVKRM